MKRIKRFFREYRNERSRIEWCIRENFRRERQESGFRRWILFGVVPHSDGLRDMPAFTLHTRVSHFLHNLKHAFEEARKPWWLVETSDFSKSKFRTYTSLAGKN